MNRKNVLKILLLLMMVPVVFIFSSCTTSNTAQSPTPAVSDSVEAIKSVSYEGIDGKSVYDLLIENSQVEADESSVGVMVKSINGLQATDKEFWLYSVNGQPAEVAADKYMTKTGDKVLWEYKGM